jgi:hypothetical protein
MTEAKKYERRQYEAERRHGTRLAQFNVSISNEEKAEIDEVLAALNLSKADFVRIAIKKLKRRIHNDINKGD